MSAVGGAGAPAGHRRPERSAGTCGATPSDLGLPDDYYDRLFAVEERHWWQRGMRQVTLALLEGRLHAGGQSMLDIGCGSGGFLRWIAGIGAFQETCGVDPSGDAITLARTRAPRARLEVARASALPFPDSRFDLAVLNDVLQHVPDDELLASLAELRRTLRPDGAVLVRTNGAMRARRERADWRIYDRRSLARALRAGGFSCERVTYANAVPSLAAAARSRSPMAPTREGHGIPALPGDGVSTVGYGLLRAEAAFLRRTSGGLPFGHTLFALAVPLP